MYLTFIMNIYFAGSIRGGREDADIYAEIITLLQKHGEVLTEHVADKSISSYGQTDMTEQEIYEKDVAMLRESDIVVAEITCVSIGVGYEIGYAESLGKKIVCLYRPEGGKRTSAMVAGNSHVQLVEYKKAGELELVFNKYF